MTINPADWKELAIAVAGAIIGWIAKHLDNKRN